MNDLIARLSLRSFWVGLLAVLGPPLVLIIEKKVDVATGVGLMVTAAIAKLMGVIQPQIGEAAAELEPPKLKCGLLAVLIALAAFLGSSPVRAQPQPLPDTHTSTVVQHGLVEIIHDATGLIPHVGFGAGVLVSGTVLRLDGTLHGLTTGLGFGPTYKFNAMKGRFPVELGLYVAPELVVDGVNQALAFAGIFHATVFRGFGGGIGYEFFNDRFKSPSSHQLFLVAGFSPTNDALRAR